MNIFVGCPGAQYTFKFLRLPSWTPVWVNRLMMMLIAIPVTIIMGIIIGIFQSFACVSYQLRYSNKALYIVILTLLGLLYFGLFVMLIQWMGWIDIWSWFGSSIEVHDELVDAISKPGITGIMT